MVVRRRAAHGGEDVRVLDLHPVAALDALGLARHARAVQRREQKIARAIAREDAPRAVAAVRRRREPDDHEARLRIAEPGDAAQ